MDFKKQEFIKKTFAHVFGASILFIALEVLYFNTFIINSIWNIFIHVHWLLFVGGFALASWIAAHLASDTKNKGMQYSGLALYTIAESIIFAPLLAIAYNQSGPEILVQAGVITVIGFGLLSGLVIKSGKNFSFLNNFLAFGGLIALIAIVIGSVTSFTLGLWFSVVMVIFAGFAILRDTSDLMHKYDDDQYVAAALSLFSSMMLMLWYVLRILMKLNKK